MKERSLIVGKINLSNGSIKYWDEPSAASTRNLAVEKINKRIYVAIYDDAEEDLLILRDVAEHATSEYIIYSFDYNLGDKQEVLYKFDSINISVHTIYKAIYFIYF
ncbi:hypothetical protein [Tissierella sp.]|uniref:hypothetical protein n=1 Tax=Tissierella sp. TaxID=41274 RepID=UPI0028AEF10C|nr:hypothetical protein [Tissierella sp.]